MNKFFWALLCSLVSTASMAQEAASSGFTDKGAYYIAAIIGVGIAAFGGAMGQGRASASALEGIARNPGSYKTVFTPLLLCLALMESLVIFTITMVFIVK